jgi:REP element-mobilizing transposase RayT
MSRPLRIELAGGLYHVTSRGDCREAIYLSDADRQQWLTILAEACQHFNWRCHAWCQMTNHYHLVVETPEANLAQGMRQLNGVSTQYINRAHRRIGHVFQGHYKAILVERPILSSCPRYLVLNPVRAGMVSLPGEWP